MTFNSISGFVSSVIAGSLVDRFGRKGMMVIGLFGMAIVYLADDLKHGRRVAIKVLQPEVAATIGGS